MTMDIHEILKRLPHRYPFLLVDRVLELEHGKRIRALKNVTMNEPFFVGHFPHRPVMPGVLILEALAQAAAILAFDNLGVRPDDKTVFYFVGIDRARFKRPVEPGDQLILHVTLDRMKAGIVKFTTARAGRRHGRRRGRPDVHDAPGGLKDTSAVMAKVHPTALVERGAELGRRVAVGPYASSARRCASARARRSAPHCVIEGRTTIGRDNRIFQFCSLGAMPQDKKYAGEPTELEIGDRNTIREFCTFNLGTAQDGGVTRIGDDNWIMAYVHIAHDCQVGDQTILANNATLAGHVHLGDWVIVGGLTGVHQFVKIGAHAMAGFASAVTQDVPPFMMVDGNPLAVRGFNVEGLRRRGFGAERIAAVKQMHRLLYRSGKTFDEARAAIAALAGDDARGRGRHRDDGRFPRARDPRHRPLTMR